MNNFDVFVVGESRVKGVGRDSLQIAGYQLFRLDRDYPGESPNDGGLLIYVRDVLACRHVRSENRPLHNNFGTRVSLLQFIELELTFRFDVVSIVAVYNPPWVGADMLQLCSCCYMSIETTTLELYFLVTSMLMFIVMRIQIIVGSSSNLIMCSVP